MKFFFTSLHAEGWYLALGIRYNTWSDNELPLNWDNFLILPATTANPYNSSGSAGGWRSKRQSGYSKFITGANIADLPSTAVLPQLPLWHLRTGPPVKVLHLRVKLSPSSWTSICKVTSNFKIWINSFSLPSFLKLGNHTQNQPMLQLKWNPFNIKYPRVREHQIYGCTRNLHSAPVCRHCD